MSPSIPSKSVWACPGREVHRPGSGFLRTPLTLGLPAEDGFASSESLTQIRACGPSARGRTPTSSRVPPVTRACRVLPRWSSSLPSQNKTGSHLMREPALRCLSSLGSSAEPRLENLPSSVPPRQSEQPYISGTCVLPAISSLELEEPGPPEAGFLLVWCPSCVARLPYRGRAPPGSACARSPDGDGFAPSTSLTQRRRLATTAEVPSSEGLRPRRRQGSPRLRSAPHAVSPTFLRLRLRAGRAIPHRVLRPVTTSPPLIGEA